MDRDGRQHRPRPAARPGRARCRTRPALAGARITPLCPRLGSRPVWSTKARTHNGDAAWLASGRSTASSNSARCPARCRAPGCTPGTAVGMGTGRAHRQHRTGRVGTGHQRDTGIPHRAGRRYGCGCYRTSRRSWSWSGTPARTHQSRRTSATRPKTAGACCWSRPSVSNGPGTSQRLKRPGIRVGADHHWRTTIGRTVRKLAGYDALRITETSSSRVSRASWSSHCPNLVGNVAQVVDAHFPPDSGSALAGEGGAVVPRWRACSKTRGCRSTWGCSRCSGCG